MRHSDGPDMRIVIAPDGFKGSLSGREAAEAIRRGVEGACPDADIELCPLSDGGEGLLDVLAMSRGGSVHETRVTGPVGSPVDARWALSGDGRTAIIESAAAIGLGLVPERERRPLETTTHGVGELLRTALAAGARTVVVGLGGSATTDAGAGMAQALGVVIDGVDVPAVGGRLGDARRIDSRGRAPELSEIEVLTLTDVDNPLTGPEGAAHVYGAQKGATETERFALDAALAHFAALAGDAGTEPGDGAAGGLGYGLRRFAGARRLSGIDHVLDAVQFEAKLRGCDLVLTGEGRLDAQSARGKVVSGVCRRCRSHGVPVIALVGAIGSGAGSLEDAGLTAYFSACERPMTEQDAMASAKSLLEGLARNVVRAWARTK